MYMLFKYNYVQEVMYVCDVCLQMCLVCGDRRSDGVMVPQYIRLKVYCEIFRLLVDFPRKLAKRLAVNR